MKRKLLAITLVLLAGSVLLASAQTSPDKSQPTGSRLIISDYGTLLDVVGPDGKSRFGKLDLDGFSVNYVAEGKTRSVLAIGATNVKGLQPGQVKLDGQSASITVRTADGRLEITSHFSLNEETNKLTVRRGFRNISGGMLSSLVTNQYVDARLIPNEQPAAGALNLVQLAKGQIKTGGDPEDCQLKECIPDQHPCLTRNCPLPVPSLSMTDTKLGRQLSFRWKERALIKAADESCQVIQLDLKVLSRNHGAF